MAFLSSHSFQHSLHKRGLSISAGDQVAGDVTGICGTGDLIIFIVTEKTDKSPFTN